MKMTNFWEHLKVQKIDVIKLNVYMFKSGKENC